MNAPSMIEWRLIVIVVCVAHIVFCPFTKVEESFNVQAVHDFLFHGTAAVDKFDHLQYPGVVRRTFVGAAALAATSEVVVGPVSLFARPTNATKIYGLYVVRVIMAALVSVALHVFARSALSPYSSRVTTIWYLIVVSQFHLMFYASRLLPNIFALVSGTISIACWARNYQLQRDCCDIRSFFVNATYLTHLALAALTCLIFRFELSILFAVCLALDVRHLCRRVSCGFARLALKSAFATAARLACIVLPIWLLTVFVDSYMWRHYITWPEYDVFHFNIIANRSQEWGVSPWHWYVTSALPKSLLLAYPFAVVGCVVGDHHTRRLAAPAATFVAVMSCLGHKEWRFIVYTIPVFTAVAAVTIEAAALSVQQRWSAAKASTMLKVIVLAVCVINIAFTAVGVTVSRQNYPGGKALAVVHQQWMSFDSAQRHPHAGFRPVVVHLDNLACQTGVSRFAEMTASTWQYDKSEGLTLNQKMTSPIDYTFIVHEASQLGQDEVESIARHGYRHAHTISTYSYLTVQCDVTQDFQWQIGRWCVPRIIMKDALVVLVNNRWPV